MFRTETGAARSLILWTPAMASLLTCSALSWLEIRPAARRWRAPTLNEALILICSYGLACLSWFAYSLLSEPGFSLRTASRVALGAVVGASATFIALNLFVILLIGLKKRAA